MTRDGASVLPPPTREQAAEGGVRPDLPVNSSERFPPWLLTRLNLGVNGRERLSEGGTLHLLTRATSGLTTKRERERVSGPELLSGSPLRASLVNRTRGGQKRSAEDAHNRRRV